MRDVEKLKTYLMTYIEDLSYFDIDDPDEAMQTLTAREFLEKNKKHIPLSELTVLYENDKKAVYTIKSLLKKTSELGKIVYTDLYNIALKNIAEYEKSHKKAGQLKTSNYKPMIADNSAMDEKQKLDELVKAIGKDRKCGFKVGDSVPAYANMPNTAEKTSVVKIENDLVGNEVFFTEMNYNQHLNDKYHDKSDMIRERTMQSIKKPDFVLLDKEAGAVVYGKYMDNEVFMSAFVGSESLRYFTTYERKKMFDKLGKRYNILYGDIRK